MKMLIHLQAMPDADVLDLIPTNKFLEMKRRDPHPLFKAYVVGQEGFFSPKVVGKGQQLMEWVDSTIRRIVDKLKLGTKVFIDHNEDSSHAGRQSVGEVVGTGLDWIDEKTSALAVVYIKPDFRDMNLDVASLELQAEIQDQGQDIPNVLIDDITGIALGDSRIHKPAFPGATLQGELQAFVDKYTVLQGGDTMDLDQIKQLIKSGGHRPSDVFGLDELTKDPIVVTFIDTTTQSLKTKLTGEYIQRQDLKGESEKNKTDAEKAHDKEVKELNEKLTTQGQEIAKGKVPGMFKTEAKRRKLTERQLGNIEADLGLFIPEDPEKIEVEFPKWLDDQVTREGEMAKRYGVEEEVEEKPDEELTEEERAEKKAEAEAGGIGPTKQKKTKSNINEFLPTMSE